MLPQSFIDEELANVKLPKFSVIFETMLIIAEIRILANFAIFLLFYSPIVLKKLLLLPPPILKTLDAVLAAIWILLRRTVSVLEVEIAQLMIYKFVPLILRLFAVERHENSCYLRQWVPGGVDPGYPKTGYPDSSHLPFATLSK
jgi:hypothetical protein